MWQGIESDVAALEKATEGAADVKLLQLELAMRQGDFTRAEGLLAELKKDGSWQPRIALAAARLLATQDKNSEAVSTLTQAAEEFPDSVELVNYLATLLVRQGNFDECEAIIKDALDRIERPLAQRELGLLLAQTYTQQGEPNKTYELLKTLTKKLPGDIPLKRRFLACEQVMNNPERAEQIVDNIKTLEGKDGWQWRYEQARVWFAGDDFKGRYPQITSLLQENLLVNPNDQASRVLLAAAYDRAGELHLAVSTYHEALARSPDDLRIIIPAVPALYRAREYDQADEILNRALQKELYHRELQKLQVQSYLRRGQLSPASDIVEDILRRDPNDQATRFTLALLKVRQKQFGQAEQLLAELKSQDPDLLAVTYAQVQLNILQDKREEACKICDELVGKLNNASAHILRARTYTAVGQANDAAEDLERATAIEPNNVEVWIARSEFYRSMDRPDLAVADIEQALSLSPDNVQIQKRAISLLLASSERDTFDKGRILLHKALQSNPEDIELRLSKARLLLAEGTAPAIRNAQQVLQNMTEEHPAVVQAWVLLGEIFLGQADPAKAIDAAMRGLVHQRNDKSLLLLKARAEAGQSPALAIPTFKSLRELDPNDVDIAIQLAMTHIAAGEPEKAVDLLEKQLTSCEDVPEQRRVNTALAVALYKRGDKENARKKFNSLLQSARDDPAPLFARVQLLTEDELWSQLRRNVAQWCENSPDDVNTPITIAGRLAATENNQAREVAESLLRRVLEHDPDNLTATNRLAMLLQVAGRHTESAELYQRILELRPDSVIAMNNLAWLICEEQGRYQQALELAERGLKLAPQYVDLIDTRGVVYYRLGEFEKAIRDFRTCLELYPSGTPLRVASRFHLARVQAKNGEPSKAIEELNQVLDLHRRTGGLSAADLAEAERLRELLQRSI
jgi:tetratricopeptide (TPR) repeat protein